VDQFFKEQRGSVEQAAWLVREILALNNMGGKNDAIRRTSRTWGLSFQMLRALHHPSRHPKTVSAQFFLRLCECYIRCCEIQIAALANDARRVSALRDCDHEHASRLVAKAQALVDSLQKLP
jgi:hypothetical protein